MKISRIQIIGNLIGLLPAFYLLSETLMGNLSADPIRTTTIITGRTSIYAMLLSLFCTPLARIFRMSVFHPIRKISGLFAFYYAFAHFLIFSFFDYQLNLDWIIPEIKQKPFLQVGLIALILLIPLAVSSIKPIRQKMGKYWKKIHRLVYFIAAIILVHITIASKGDIVDPIVLIAIYTLAMSLRLPQLRSFKIKSLPDWLKNVNAYLTNKNNAS